MSDKDYRRDWAQAAALKKIRELKGRGMSNVAIGALAGVTGVYIGNLLRADDPKPVSKKVWDALIAKTDFVPLEPGASKTSPLTDEVKTSILAEPAAGYGSRTDELLKRILKAQEEQALLIKTLTELIIARKGK